MRYLGRMVPVLENAEENQAPGAKGVEELTLLIAVRARRLAEERDVPPGGELDLWLQAEADVKRELHRS